MKERMPVELLFFFFFTARFGMINGLGGYLGMGMAMAMAMAMEGRMVHSQQTTNSDLDL